MIEKTITDLYNLLIVKNSFPTSITMTSPNYKHKQDSKTIGLDPNKNYMLHVQGGQTQMNFYAITKGVNDGFEYYSPNSSSWFLFTHPEGICYGVEGINYQLASFMLINGDITQKSIDKKEFVISIIPNDITLGSVIKLGSYFGREFASKKKK